MRPLPPFASNQTSAFTPGAQYSFDATDPSTYDPQAAAQSQLVQQYATGQGGQSTPTIASKSGSDIHSNLPDFNWGEMAVNPSGYLKQRGMQMLGNQINALFKPNTDAGPSTTNSLTDEGSAADSVSAPIAGSLSTGDDFVDSFL